MSNSNFSNIAEFRFAFWTEAPPLLNNAIGTSSIARQVLECLQHNIPLLITSKLRRKNTISEIRTASAVKNIFFCPDISWTGIRRFFPRIADIIDLILFIINLPFLRSSLKQSGSHRVFALFGADGFSLWKVLALTFLGVPVDIYMVDDLEESAKKNDHRLLLLILPGLIKICLLHCSCIFTISPGFSEHLKLRYNIESVPLFLPHPIPPKKICPYNAQKNKTRKVTFIGALNFLYESSLILLYNIILSHNDKYPDQPLNLQIVTYSNPSAFTNKLPNFTACSIYQNVDHKILSEMLNASWAVLLPYSFEDAEKIMVQTSFSCKILEYFQSGRPIIVFGPANASIPRHFLQNQVPFCASSPNELQLVISELLTTESDNTVKINEAYLNLWKKFHSPECFLKTYQEYCLHD